MVGPKGLGWRWLGELKSFEMNSLAVVNGEGRH